MSESRIPDDQALMEIYRLRLEADPKSRLFLPLAVLCRKLGHTEEAIRLCSEGLEVHPDYHSARLNLALSYLDQGNMEEAASQLEQVIRVRPDNFMAREALAEAYRRCGRIKEAAREFQSLRELAPHRRKFYPKLKELQHLQPDEEDKLPELHPEDIELEEILAAPDEASDLQEEVLFDFASEETTAEERADGEAKPVGAADLPQTGNESCIREAQASAAVAAPAVPALSGLSAEQAIADTPANVEIDEDELLDPPTEKEESPFPSSLELPALEVPSPASVDKGAQDLQEMDRGESAEPVNTPVTEDETVPSAVATIAQLERWIESIHRLYPRLDASS